MKNKKETSLIGVFWLEEMKFKKSHIIKPHKQQQEKNIFRRQNFQQKFWSNHIKFIFSFQYLEMWILYEKI